MDFFNHTSCCYEGTMKKTEIISVKSRCPCRDVVLFSSRKSARKLKMKDFRLAVRGCSIDAELTLFISNDVERKYVRVTGRENATSVYLNR